jgi:hypothetical protein
MGRAIATTEAKAEKAEAKRIAKQLAKAVLDATPEAMAKAEAKAMAKASARAVAAAKLIYEAELHAREVEIATAKEDASRLVDNGCTAGMKLFSMTNLAMRMTDFIFYFYVLVLNLIYMTCNTNKMI